MEFFLPTVARLLTYVIVECTKTVQHLEVTVVVTWSCDLELNKTKLKPVHIRGGLELLVRNTIQIIIYDTTKAKWSPIRVKDSDLLSR